MDILKEFEDDARIEKQDESIVGPYKASFPGKTIFILDEKADVEESDVILRELPNGKDERFASRGQVLRFSLPSLPGKRQDLPSKRAIMVVGAMVKLHESSPL